MSFGGPPFTPRPASRSGLRGSEHRRHPAPSQQGSNHNGKTTNPLLPGTGAIHGSYNGTGAPGSPGAAAPAERAVRQA